MLTGINGMYLEEYRKKLNDILAKWKEETKVTGPILYEENKFGDLLLYSHKPGLVIGSKGKNVTDLTSRLAKSGYHFNTIEVHEVKGGFV